MTALRWARILRGLGHQVRIGGSDEPGRAELLLALHARRSVRAVEEFRRRWPGRPVVVALTGTDLYVDLARGDPAARRSLALADRLVVLQRAALGALPAALRRRARVIHQSVALPV